MSAIIINPEIQARINQRNKIQALEDQIIHAAKNGENVEALIKDMFTETHEYLRITHPVLRAKFNDYKDN